MARGVFAFSVAVLLAVFGTGSCIMCYLCDSEADACRTIDESSEKHITDCSKPVGKDVPPVLQVVNNLGVFSGCLKIESNDGYVGRTCIVNSEFLVCNALSLTMSVKHCSICTQDYCNKSDALTASLPMGLLALIASYLFS